jgi:RNA polymerase sigma factor (TIGR02999 family)
LGSNTVLKFSRVSDITVTTLLHAWKDGDRTALDRLVPLVYAELRRMAGACFKSEQGMQTLEPTALVHEAYVRLAASGDPDFTSRSHFLGIAARVMRQILVDRARARRADKRNASARVPLEEDEVLTPQRAALVVSLDDALTELARRDPEKAQILELRYFGGLTAEESAEHLGVPAHNINRQMRLAQAWLRREMMRRKISPSLSGNVSNFPSESA